MAVVVTSSLATPFSTVAVIFIQIYLSGIFLNRAIPVRISYSTVPDGTLGAIGAFLVCIVVLGKVSAVRVLAAVLIVSGMLLMKLRVLAEICAIISFVRG